jgi:hypothetical protein
MVRRGSTVRVRQRALQKPRKTGFFFRMHLHDPQRAVGMEHPGEVGLRGASLARNLQGSSLQKAAIAAGEGADLDAVVEDASNKPP